MAIEAEDIDGDGFSTLIEVTDTTTFVNTPTFPGLTPSNVGMVTGGVDVSEIRLHLKPSTGFDLTPPVVTIHDPNGGEIVTANTGYLVHWAASDDDEVSSVDLQVSLDNGATFTLVVKGLSNSGSHTWYPANRPSEQALFRVVARDNAFNEGHDVSNSAFERDGNGNYVPNAFDAPATDASAHTLMPVERTYSEWFYSEYNTPAGVFAPQFAGNLSDGMVATCQDCHMRDVTGQGCNLGDPPVRDDLPLHDMTGGSTWLGTDCSVANDWCSGADLDQNGKVDLADFVLLSHLTGF